MLESAQGEGAKFAFVAAETRRGNSFQAAGQRRIGPGPSASSLVYRAERMLRVKRIPIGAAQSSSARSRMRRRTLTRRENRRQCGRGKGRGEGGSIGSFQIQGFSHQCRIGVPSTVDLTCSGSERFV